LGGRGAQASQRFRAHDRPAVEIAEAVFQCDLDAQRAALRDAFDHGFRRVLGGIGAGRQRMLARVLRLEDVVVEDLVARGLVHEHQWIAIHHRRDAAAPGIRMPRLRGELREALRHVDQVHHLGDAEVQVAPRLLREELLLHRRDGRIARTEGQADGIGHVHVAVHQSRGQELAAAIELARVRRRDGAVADGGDASVAHQHVLVAARLGLLGRQHGDVFDEQRLAGCMNVRGQREIGAGQRQQGDRAIHGTPDSSGLG
jgi:hypothetical protein